MLKRINPAAKLVANLILLIACVLPTDPYTPALFLGAAALAGIITGSLRFRTLKYLLLPGLFAGAMVWMNAAWAQVPNPTPIGALGPLVFTAEGLSIGISLGLRVLVITLLSLILLDRSDPTSLILSLLQQFRLSPQMAYSLMAALRFLPMLETDLSTMRAAHRIRGVDRGGLRRWYRYAIPLLAGSVRRAERVALAMEARGFAGRAPRTYYRRIPWRWWDTLFLAGTVAVAGALFALSAQMGWLTAVSRWKGF